MTRPQRVLFLGCGSVTQAALPLLIRDVKLDPKSITIIDFVDNRHRVADSLSAGVTYKQMQITPDNLAQVLGDHVSAGDMLLDLVDGYPVDPVFQLDRPGITNPAYEANWLV